MKVTIIGPNPLISYRNGGVAKFVEYQFELKKKSEIRTKFYFLDCDKLSSFKLPAFIRKYVGFIIALLQLLFAGRDKDCVHLHASLYDSGRLKNFLFAVICKIKCYPLYVQIHGGRLSKLNSLSKKVWLLIFKLSTKIGLFPGPQYEEIRMEGFNSKLLRIANFVPQNSEDVNSEKDEVPHFLFLGRIVEEKGVFLLFSEYVALREEGIYAKLTIAGNGSELDRLIAEVRGSKFENDINITGYINGKELETIKHRCNIFILPSWHEEGFPLSFLECSLKGMAPVITTQNGIPYFFQENEEYLPIFLEKNNLFMQMKKIATNTKLREKIGRHVKKKVKNRFTVDTYLPELIDVYQEVISAASKN